MVYAGRDGGLSGYLPPADPLARRHRAEIDKGQRPARRVHGLQRRQLSHFRILRFCLHGGCGGRDVCRLGRHHLIPRRRPGVFDRRRDLDRGRRPRHAVWPGSRRVLGQGRRVLFEQQACRMVADYRRRTVHFRRAGDARRYRGHHLGMGTALATRHTATDRRGLPITPPKTCRSTGAPRARRVRAGRGSDAVAPRGEAAHLQGFRLHDPQSSRFQYRGERTSRAARTERRRQNDAHRHDHRPVQACLPARSILPAATSLAGRPTIFSRPASAASFKCRTCTRPCRCSTT